MRSTSVPPQVAFTDVKVFNVSLKDGRAVDGVELAGFVDDLGAEGIAS